MTATTAVLRGPIGARARPTSASIVIMRLLPHRNDPRAAGRALDHRPGRKREARSKDCSTGPQLNVSACGGLAAAPQHVDADLEEVDVRTQIVLRLHHMIRTAQSPRHVALRGEVHAATDIEAELRLRLAGVTRRAV